MPVRSRCTVVVVLALAGWLCAPTAHAARPDNDAPGAAGVFAPYAAAAGKPVGLSAIGELGEATPDRGMPRCLGKRSFSRTVWYRVPAIGATQLLSVEAVGRTLALVDLAAYVQPNAPGATVREPNVCDGFGGGGSDATIEPTSAVSMIVPPNASVLVQVGRRGPRRARHRARLLSLDTFASDFLGPPPGTSPPSAPRLRPGRAFLSLAGATITGEDPAQAPARASARSGARSSRQERAASSSASAARCDRGDRLRGRRPKGDNAVDCVIRRAPAARLDVPVKRNRPVWVRVGHRRHVRGQRPRSSPRRDGDGATVVDGGSGGTDPTPGGPGGGFPASCDDAAVEDARVSGARCPAAPAATTASRASRCA